MQLMFHAYMIYMHSTHAHTHKTRTHIYSFIYICVWCVCLNRIHHHHHHVVPLARISLNLSRHLSLSFIASGRSSWATSRILT